MLGGELGGQGQRFFDIIAARGDRAMDFIWRHKAVLAGGAALTAFLANPEPFLSGTSDLVGTVAESTVKPAVVAVGNVAQEAAGFVRWALTILLVALAAGIGLAVRSGVFKEPAVRAAVVAGWGQVKERFIARR
jgi:hypothetical protein